MSHEQRNSPKRNYNKLKNTVATVSALAAFAVAGCKPQTTNAEPEFRQDYCFTGLEVEHDANIREKPNANQDNIVFRATKDTLINLGGKGLATTYKDGAWFGAPAWMLLQATDDPAVVPKVNANPNQILWLSDVMSDGVLDVGCVPNSTD